MYQSLGSEAAPQALEVLQALHPLFNPTQEEGSNEMVDNAAAAVARMIMATPTVVPMAAVLPVFLQVRSHSLDSVASCLDADDKHGVPLLLQALPLKADMCENETVYKCLLTLLQHGVPEIVPHVPAILGQSELPFLCPSSSIGVPDSVGILLTCILPPQRSTRGS
jgi:hypothetical protein